MTGVIDGLPLADYIRDPATPGPSLSASVAHALLTKSPRHAWLQHPRLNVAWEPDASAASELGTIAHAILLEGDESRVVVLDADDYRKKETQAARDQARADGKLPILAHRLADVRAMVTEARVAVARSEDLVGVFEGAAIERTFIWQEDGVWCRCRPDLVRADEKLVVDVKTTSASAEPHRWGQSGLLGHGADLQGAFVRRALMARTGVAPSVVYLVIESEPPYGVSFVGLSPAFEEFADQKFRHALAVWRRCLAMNEWPCYPSRICWAEPPGYAVTQFEEKRLVASVLLDGAVEDL